jgi:hypothetical protein
VGIVASKEYREKMERKGLVSIEPEEGMEALEKMLAAPANRLAFIKTNHFFDWRGIDDSESADVYPQ